MAMPETIMIMEIATKTSSKLKPPCRLLTCSFIVYSIKNPAETTAGEHKGSTFAPKAIFRLTSLYLIAYWMSKGRALAWFCYKKLQIAPVHRFGLLPNLTTSEAVQSTAEVANYMRWQTARDTTLHSLRIIEEVAGRPGFEPG